MSVPWQPADSLDTVEMPVEPRRLGQQLATLLAAEVVSGRIGVGQMFPSAEEIVTRFHVSRTVARETVQTLSMLGLVRVQHGKRSEVLPEDEWDILSSIVQQAMRRENRAAPFLRDLYDFRLLIEPHAAAWMAEHGSDEQIAELGGLAATMEGLADSDAAAGRVAEADRQFHNLVARASGNRVLAAVGRDIREILNTLWGLSHLGADERRGVAAQHRRIADLIAQRDAAAAADVMREHLDWATNADLEGLGELSARRD
jgi:GntR family transcriptional regulator, galactonate operon transcriptional repressor